MEMITKSEQIPQTDSIEALAQFWESHDITDFEDELIEVTEPVFVRLANAKVQIELPAKEFEAIQHIAQEQHMEYGELIRAWVLEKLYYAEMMRRVLKEFQTS